MILKDKEFTNPSDPRLLAGEEAEKQLAFYLKRALKKCDDYFVINDLRIIHDGETAQIDHCIVSPYGLFIIESKSCHGNIIVDKSNRWIRTINGKEEGMKSPVLQAIEQGKIVRELLRANTEKLLGKMLMGQVQRGFKYCPFLIYVAVSDSGIIKQEIDVAELYKADEVAKAITDKLDELKNKSDLLSPKFWFSSEVGWRMKHEESKIIANFLKTQHQPVSQKIPVKNDKKASQLSAEPLKTEATFVPRVGAICPKCGVSKLIRRSIKRSDSTETDFLACQGYPDSCKTIFPLVALVPQTKASAEMQEASANASIGEGKTCPQCETGKLVRKKGKNGKSDFFGCDNHFTEIKCRFMKPII